MSEDELLDKISKDNWKEVFKTLSYDSDEIEESLRRNEETILDKIFDFPEGTSILEKRNKFIRTILDENITFSNIPPNKYNEIYNCIEEIRSKQNSSILGFRAGERGATHVTFILGDKVVKFGKYFKILNNPDILQPEFSLMLNDNDNKRMTVFKRLKVFPNDDEEVTQIMYNKLRSKGILCFDLHGNNIGLTDELRDEEDDGLRIIDAECMEYAYDIQKKLEGASNEYTSYGQLSLEQAFLNYIQMNGSPRLEANYRKARMNNTLITRYEVKSASEKSSISRMQKVKDFFTGLFLRKEMGDR